LDAYKRGNLYRTQLPDFVATLAGHFIKQAKDLLLLPDAIQHKMQRFGYPLPLVHMALDIYFDYQRALRYRTALDFDDLIRLALQILRLDRSFLERLRDRWPYILEDEAQDSSHLQEQILRELAGPEGNWVRVGDPNQAIYETFTTASPKYLRHFLRDPEVRSYDLPASGRSTPSIIKLANHLIEWTQNAHPVVTLREALTQPLIRPVFPDDPQPNPPDDASKIYLVDRKFSPADEIEAVADSLGRWLPEHAEATVAVLVPRNQRGFEMAKALRQQGLEAVELLRSTPATRETAGALGNVLRYLGDPVSPTKLATVYRVWRRHEREEPDLKPRLDWATKALRVCRRVEDFLWPRVDRDWLADLDIPEHLDLPERNALRGSRVLPTLYEQLSEFRDLVLRWQGATLLPIDQLLLTLAQDLFDQPADLAIAHKLAVALRQSTQMHPEWRLPELTQELADIARNERKFLGLSDDDTGFDPEAYKGKVVVATMHKAKGLEWDRVYLMSVNNYNFPSAQPYDHYISEKWFVRDHLNLEAEMLTQLKALHDDPELFLYDEGQPTHEARREYASERLRLLYVGITRAKKELVITWNSGRRGDSQPALPFVALQAYWENREAASIPEDSNDLSP